MGSCIAASQIVFIISFEKCSVAFNWVIEPLTNSPIEAVRGWYSSPRYTTHTTAVPLLAPRQDIKEHKISFFCQFGFQFSHWAGCNGHRLKALVGTQWVWLFFLLSSLKLGWYFVTALCSIFFIYLGLVTWPQTIFGANETWTGRDRRWKLVKTVLSCFHERQGLVNMRNKSSLKAWWAQVKMGEDAENNYRDNGERNWSGFTFSRGRYCPIYSLN